MLMLPGGGSFISTGRRRSSACAPTEHGGLSPQHSTKTGASDLCQCTCHHVHRTASMSVATPTCGPSFAGMRRRQQCISAGVLLSHQWISGQCCALMTGLQASWGMIPSFQSRALPSRCCRGALRIGVRCWPVPECSRRAAAQRSTGQRSMLHY